MQELIGVQWYHGQRTLQCFRLLTCACVLPAHSLATHALIIHLHTFVSEMSCAFMDYLGPYGHDTAVCSDLKSYLVRPRFLLQLS